MSSIPQREDPGDEGVNFILTLTLPWLILNLSQTYVIR